MSRGFTLLEIIVAVGLFTIVAFLATTSLLILNNAQRRTFFIQTNQDNVRFALESMAREIRTGVTYKSTTDSMGPCAGLSPALSCLAFTNSLKQDVVYKYSSGSITKSINMGTFYPITAPEVLVSAVRFYVAGQDLRDKYQSRVTIVIRATTPGADPNAARLDAQTTVNRLRRDTQPQ